MSYSEKKRKKMEEPTREEVFCYSSDEGALVWYDTEESEWNELEGFVGLPQLSPDSVRLADYGGKMVVLWIKYLPSSDERMIWCAEITLESVEYIKNTQYRD
ncbi:unnamed protein product [Thlaspi arvense]|uniref:FKB95-like N-terminal Kelch domain-containing protein n=1 Tax=Thlaspi arvense TaxID=13288 RepID=A0AAU9RWW4_THLAR|nr:unnamed protein product [Thlaspi arvense]